LLKQQIAGGKNDKTLPGRKSLYRSVGEEDLAVTRVLRSGQNFFVYLEVCNPGVSGEDTPGQYREGERNRDSHTFQSN
jgi:hypothetical protein